MNYCDYNDTRTNKCKSEKISSKLLISLSTLPRPGSTDNGFQKTEIFVYRPSIFSDHIFATSKKMVISFRIQEGHSAPLVVPFDTTLFRNKKWHYVVGKHKVLQRFPLLLDRITTTTNLLLRVYTHAQAVFRKIYGQKTAKTRASNKAQAGGNHQVPATHKDKRRPPFPRTSSINVMQIPRYSVHLSPSIRG